MAVDWLIMSSSDSLDSVAAPSSASDKTRQIPDKTSRMTPLGKHIRYQPLIYLQFRTYLISVEAGWVAPTRTWAQDAPISGNLAPFTNNQDRNLEIVAHGIDCSPKNEIHQAAMSVRPHDQQIGFDLAGILDDLALGVGGMGDRR